MVCYLCRLICGGLRVTLGQITIFFTGRRGRRGIIARSNNCFSSRFAVEIRHAVAMRWSGSNATPYVWRTVALRLPCDCPRVLCIIIDYCGPLPLQELHGRPKETLRRPYSARTVALRYVVCPAGNARPTHGSDCRSKDGPHRLMVLI